MWKRSRKPGEVDASAHWSGPGVVISKTGSHGLWVDLQGFTVKTSPERCRRATGEEEVAQEVVDGVLRKQAEALKTEDPMEYDQVGRFPEESKLLRRPKEEEVEVKKGTGGKRRR